MIILWGCVPDWDRVGKASGLDGFSGRKREKQVPGARPIPRWVRADDYNSEGGRYNRSILLWISAPLFQDGAKERT